MILTGLGGGTPGGSTTQIQYNNAGVFGGDSALVWNSTTDQVISGSLSDINANLLAYATEGPSVVGIGRAKGFGYSVGAIGISSSSTEDTYGVESLASVSASGLTAVGTEAAAFAFAAGSSAIAFRVFANANTFGGPAYNATALYSIYSYAPSGSNGATATTGYHLWMQGGAIASVGNSYFIWADALGVYRIREDAVADGASFPQAIPALYNPRFTKYTPGAANYERGVQQWVSNVYQMGAEAGGTGTLRAIKIIGASLDVPATFTVGGLPISSTPGGSTTQLQYNNAGAFGGITGATTNGTTLTLVAPVLGAATATSISVGTNTPGFTQQRPNANTSQILIQSTVPPEGRLHEAPFMWLQGGAAFDAGEWDPVMYLGYNADRGVTTEPTMRWVVEGNYSHGTRDVESYWEYLDRSDLAGGGAWRPIMITMNKDTLSGKSLSFNSGFAVDPQPGLTDVAIDMNGSNYYGSQIRAMRASSAATRRLTLMGAADPTTGAFISVNNAAWSVGPSTTYRGAVVMNAGNPSSPVSGTADGAVVLATGDNAGGTFSTERFRVQFDGAIAVNKPGVHATALMHLGPGTATASTAPLKFTSGTLNTAAEAGAVEFLTDAFYGTITTGAARKTFAFLESPSFTTPALGVATGTRLAITEAVGASGLTVTGATQTANFPALSVTQTWNNAGVTFIGALINITSTASAAASNLFDAQLAGVSKFKIGKTGDITLATATYLTAANIVDVNNGYRILNVTGLVTLVDTGAYRWSSTNSAAGTADLILTREGAATLQMGVDVNGAAVAQTFKSHDGITGTNIAGANLTVAGGRGTGTGAPGNLIFQTAVQVASGTTAQTLATRLQIIENKIGFFGVTPVVQGASIDDATGGAIIDAEARTALNALISRIEATGLIATV